jgi:hypothetical protein
MYKYDPPIKCWHCAFYLPEDNMICEDCGIYNDDYSDPIHFIDERNKYVSQIKHLLVKLISENK